MYIGWLPFSKTQFAAFRFNAFAYVRTHGGVDYVRVSEPPTLSAVNHLSGWICKT